MIRRVLKVYRGRGEGGGHGRVRVGRGGVLLLGFKLRSQRPRRPRRNIYIFIYLHVGYLLTASSRGDGGISSCARGLCCLVFYIVVLWAALRPLVKIMADQYSVFEKMSEIM